MKDKYVSREFQSFGVNLAEKLEDARRKGLYIKFAKTIPRPLLEMALRFVIDANAKNKAALFMWKLKEMGAFPSTKSKTQSSNVKQNPKTKVRI